MLEHWRALGVAVKERDLGKGLAALSALVKAAATAAGSTLELPGLAEVCAKLDGLPKLVRDATAILVPGDTSSADKLDEWSRTFATIAKNGSPGGFKVTAVPGEGDPVVAAAVAESAGSLLQSLSSLEALLPDGASVGPGLRQVRVQLAVSAAKMAAALAELRRAQDALVVPLPQGCQVPPAMLSAVVALDTARKNALGAASALAGQLPVLASQLAVANGAADDAKVFTDDRRKELKAAAAAAGNQARVAALHALRLHRAMTLLAVTVVDVKDGVGGGRQKAVQEVEADLRAVAKLAGDPAQGRIIVAADALNAAVSTLGNLETETRQRVAALRVVAIGQTAAGLDALQQELDNTSQAILKVAAAVEEKIEAGFVDLVQRLGPSVIEVAQRADGALLGVIGGVLGPVAAIYDTVVDARQRLLHLLNSEVGAGGILKAWLDMVRARLGTALFTVPAPNGVPAGTDGLEYESGLATKAAKATTLVEQLNDLEALVAAWQEPGPAVLRIATQLKSLDAEFVRTILLSVIDLRELRRVVDSAIRELIPSRVTLKYDLSTALRRFPDSEGAIFFPDPDTKLVVSASTVVDLLNLREGPKVKVAGEIGPFKIALLGKQFDVVTLLFDGISFKSGSGISPDLQVRFRDVQMGEKAKFLQTVQSYLSPKNGGFYISFPPGGRGIEAGYGINLGVIGVGYLSFSNIVLNAAVQLPFDNSPAHFRISIGRSDAPFLISSTVFGGGGYLGLISAADRIVGFEASFDFGGVLAFGFGPLTGIGRVTMGIYVRMEGDRSAMGATFFVGGAAHIACFAVSTSMMIRLTQEGGAMQGTASYEFSFSLGFKDITFTVVAHKNAGSTMGSGTQTAQLEGGRTMLASAAADTKSDAGPLVTLRSVNVPRVEARGARAVGVAYADDWKRHRDYFDPALRPSKRWRPM